MGRHISRFMIIVLLTVLTGCTGQPAGERGHTEDENITLRIAWWGGGFRNEATIGVIKMYEQQHPNVHIEFEYSGFNEYWKKLAPSAAGNVLPDILQMDVSYLTQYSSLDLLEDLSPYLHQGGIDPTFISESNLSGGRLDGKLYGISLGVNALSTFYDPEVFKANGIAPPAESWTWADLDTMGEALKGKGTYLGTYLTPEQFFSYYLRQQGASLFSTDGEGLGYEEDRLFTDYFGRMQRLARDKLIFAPDIWMFNIKNPAEDPFYKGEALLGWGYSNQFISTVERYGKPLAIAPMPGPDQARGMFLKPSMFFSMAKSSRHKEEAAKFLDFFVNDVEANKLLKGERGVPVSSKVKEELKPFLEPEMVQVVEYIDWVEQNSSPMDPPEPVLTSKVVSELRSLYDLLLFGQITPEAAAAEFRLKAEGILKGNYK
ncbi:extracellular solute-binding protein [Paenibacillus albidus]|uniref:ABC transporter substrate-binding protein n=1 Tax=Paenibacillus albidus TaxID=2041023 RepID=UPI001BE66870|nr:extracellular solute-binding protein [Paenibacillus albidus]MBT2289651.1 extracellular solute-binding protein [Paenibacillus albidus]